MTRWDPNEKVGVRVWWVHQNLKIKRVTPDKSYTIFTQLLLEKLKILRYCGAASKF